MHLVFLQQIIASKRTSPIKCTSGIPSAGLRMRVLNLSLSFSSGFRMQLEWCTMGNAGGSWVVLSSTALLLVSSVGFAEGVEWRGGLVGVTSCLDSWTSALSRGEYESLCFPSSMSASEFDAPRLRYLRLRVPPLLVVLPRSLFVTSASILDSPSLL